MSSFISGISETWSVLSLILSIVYILTILFIIMIILFEDQNPLKTISWVIVVMVLPVLGIVIYLNFGRKFRKEKLFSRKGLADFENMQTLTQNQILYLDKHHFVKDEKVSSKLRIIRLLLNNSKALLTARNKIQVLINGTTTFEAIIQSIENAKDHIHLEYYIYEADELGKKIRDLLVEKAKQGVEVRFIYDAVGSWGLKKRFLKTFTNNGIEVASFMPVHFPLFTHRINYRNHRKIIVVDGTEGYVGGINIADRYINGTKQVGSWRDNHLQIKGDAVHSLQAVFLTDWYFVSNKLINGKRYFPDHQIQEEHLVQITASGPDSDWASIMQAYFTAITTANRYIYISTPYFIPNESILTALKIAALSGVNVKILLPGKSEFSIHIWTSNSFLEDLLEAGVEVYLYQKGFNHGKLMIVDGIFASIGTANMDLRSFDKNFEINALLYDEKAAQELEEQFLNDVQDSQQVILEEFLERPLFLKMKESMARMLSPLF